MKRVSLCFTTLAVLFLLSACITIKDADKYDMTGDDMMETASASETVPETVPAPETVPETVPAPETVPETVPTSETVPETVPTSETVPETSSTPETVPETSSTPETESETTVQVSNGIRPEFKEAMDAYEAFYKDYCDFMKKYSENPADLSMLTEYASMLVKLNEMNQAFESWDSADMNNEELKYYLDVNNRVTKMLVDVAG